MRSPTGWVFLCLLSPLPAQTAGVLGTLPKGFAKTEANSSFYAGWRYAPARTLTLIPARNVPSNLKTVKGLRVRPNFDAHSAKTVTVEVAMADRGVLTKEPYYIFWSRFLGTNRTVVTKRRSIRFPAVPYLSKAPVPWSRSIVLPFDKPWTRSSSSPTNLAIDVKFFTTKYESTYWYADAVFLSKYGAGSPFGKGCPTSAHATYARGGYVGSKGFSTYGYTQAPGDLAIALLGAVRKTLPLPGGCNLYLIPLLVHPRIAKTTGKDGATGDFLWGKVPASLADKEILTQILALSPSSGLEALSGYSFRIGRGYWDQATLFNYSRPYKLVDPDKTYAVYYTDVAVIYGFY